MWRRPISFLFILFLIVAHDAGQNTVAGTAVPLLRRYKQQQQQRGSAFSTASLLGRGHSHNDYWQDEPFDSAIRHGLRSIEVDVFPRSNSLLVGHTIFELDRSRCIVSMYIQPLLQWIDKKRQEQLDEAHRIVHRQNDMTFSFMHDEVTTSTRTTELYNRDAIISFLPNDFRGGSSTWSGQQQQARRLLQPSANPRELSQQQQQQTSKNARPQSTRTRTATKRLLELDSNSILLLVDFKGDPVKSMALLETAIAPLRPYLSRVTKKGVFQRGQVTVLISGNRPSKEALLIQHTARHKGYRYFFVDGRECDLDDDDDTSSSATTTDSAAAASATGIKNTALFVPMVSIPWRQVQWRARSFLRSGNGSRSNNDNNCNYSYMRQLADKAHAQGKLFRIWGAPNEESIWRDMVQCNVDLLSIDNHSKFLQFAQADGQQQQ